jgi:hypothetical protein
MINLDFSRIAYPIEGIREDERVIETFPDLMSQAHIFDREDDLPAGVNNDKVMRYLIYMFSPGTPVKPEFPDIQKRKQFVLKKLELTANEEETTADGYGEMCLMRQMWIIERFLAFTRIQCSVDYTLGATYESRMYAMQKALLTASVDKSTDDTNYQKGLEGYRKGLEEIVERIMMDEKSVVAQKAVMFSIKSESLGIDPETYTRIFREKREVFPEIRP